MDSQKAIVFNLKEKFRHEILAQISALSDSDRQKIDQNIFSQLIQFFKSRSGYWAGFSPLRSEPQINWSQLNTQLNDQTMGQTKSPLKWCFPKTHNKTMSYFTDIQSWKKSSLNVLEPEDGHAVSMTELTGACIPGLGFNMNGQRLGRGSGFFDRTFFGFKGIKVGLCFDYCLRADIPVEDHDVKMDYIITDKQIVKLVGN